MKHLITSLIITTALASAAVLQASPGYGGKRYDDCQQSGRYMSKGPGKFGDGRFVERMARQLNLSDGQYTAVRAIVEQARPQMQQIREKMRGNREQLQGLMQQDGLDETVLRQLADQQGRYKADMIVLRSRMRSDIAKQLNDTQRQQLQEMRERRKQKWR